MIPRENAIEIQQLALAAIPSLAAALNLAISHGSSDTIADVKRGVGLSIGTIETELVSVLTRLYPDIDDIQR